MNYKLLFFFLYLLQAPLNIFAVSPPLLFDRMNRWARKEAERLVKLREAQGLPLIPENYYDPDSLVLPDDDDQE